MEKEAAKLEKLGRINRNHEKLSKSSERVGGRSGSLERRKSGEDTAVSNQFTVHGKYYLNESCISQTLTE